MPWLMRTGVGIRCPDGERSLGWADAAGSAVGREAVNRVTSTFGVVGVKYSVKHG